MHFYKAETMSAPLLKISTKLWEKLIEHLRVQSDGVRESGAFLLGHKTNTGRVMTCFLPYEQLQADALYNDYVSLTASSFAKLWGLCRSEGLTIVADVHTHRLGPEQSLSDCTNPMVALKGHIAFIVPYFAKGQIRLQDLGMYVYEGSHKWVVYSSSDICRMVKLTGDRDFDDFA